MNLFLLLSGLGILFVCICVGIAILKHEWFSEPAFKDSWMDSEEFNQPTDLPKWDEPVENSVHVTKTVPPIIIKKPTKKTKNTEYIPDVTPQQIIDNSPLPTKKPKAKRATRRK